LPDEGDDGEVGKSAAADGGDVIDGDVIAHLSDDDDDDDYDDDL